MGLRYTGRRARMQGDRARVRGDGEESCRWSMEDLRTLAGDPPSISALLLCFKSFVFTPAHVFIDDAKLEAMAFMFKNATTHVFVFIRQISTRILYLCAREGVSLPYGFTAI